jgi:hypothetical protein
MDNVAIAIKTYYDFAKKYKIPVTIQGKPKGIEQIRREIKEYERKNNIKNGLYF